MSISDRILKIVNKLFDGNKRAFSLCVGVSSAVIENIVGKRKSNPSYEVTYKILSSLDNICPEWLLLGKGDMLKLNNQKPLNSDLSLPRIPINASTGFLVDLQTDKESLSCQYEKIIPSLPHYDFTMLMHGDSMLPNYVSGDELACLFVNSQEFVQWGRVFVLDTTQGIILKTIIEDGDKVICKSLNPSSYGDFSILKSDINALALVVGVIRRL